MEKVLSKRLKDVFDFHDLVLVEGTQGNIIYGFYYKHSHPRLHISLAEAGVLLNLEDHIRHTFRSENDLADLLQKLCKDY